ncbi:hypothetical protein AB0H92_34380 [Streptomyces phaeochromogenes]|uniref:hypothetical protein n=1 Tax=Streptomyces phaeochromogenes TaxID=1923 RepID=UPI003400303C
MAEDDGLALGVGGLGQVAGRVEVEHGGTAGVVLGLPLRGLQQVDPPAGAGLGELEALVLAALVVLRDGDGAVVAVDDLGQRPVGVVRVLRPGLALGEGIRAVRVLLQVLAVALGRGEGTVRVLREAEAAAGGVVQHGLAVEELEVALVLLPPTL